MEARRELSNNMTRSASDEAREIVERLLRRRVLDLSDVNAVRKYLDEDSVLHHQVVAALASRDEEIAGQRLINAHLQASRDEWKALQERTHETLQSAIKQMKENLARAETAEARLAEARKVIEKIERLSGHDNTLAEQAGPIVFARIGEIHQHAGAFLAASTPSPEPSKDGAITPSELGTLRKHSRDVSECHRILNEFGLPRGDGLPDRLRSFLWTKNAKAIDAE